MTILANNLVWLEVAAWARAQIDAAHIEMEHTVRFPGADDFTRGRIAMLRDLLKLPDVVKKPEFPESPSY